VANVEAATIVTSVTGSEFETVFDYTISRSKASGNAVWYAQIQAGGGASHELELGNNSGSTDTSEAVWNNNVDNLFTLTKDGSGNIDLVFNGAGTGDGLPVTLPFNEIWFEIRLATNDPYDVLSTNTTSTDGPTLLPNLSITGATNGNPVRTGYKFHFDDQLSGIDTLTNSGNLNPNMLTGVATGERFTVTWVGVNNTDLVPEPSTCMLLILSAIGSVIFRRTSYNKM